MGKKREATFHPSEGLHMLHIGQLTYEALGKEVTLASPEKDTYITGPLVGVTHQVDLIETTALCDSEPTYTPGRVTTSLQVGEWAATGLRSTTLIGIRLG